MAVFWIVAFFFALLVAFVLWKERSDENRSKKYQSESYYAQVLYREWDEPMGEQIYSLKLTKDKQGQLVRYEYQTKADRAGEGIYKHVATFDFAGNLLSNERTLK